MKREQEKPMKFIGSIKDRLYGVVEFDSKDLKIFQTREIARLRHVSLSAVPTWTIPTGLCASKFEHSVGVAHLAKIVGTRPEFRDVARDLYFAALAHDLGTPPFSHVSEYYLLKLTGKNHEEFADEVIGEGEFAKEVINQGGNVERILALVMGKDKPMSDLVNGTIDIDNLDNTIRYGLSMGLLADLLYSPEELAKAFAIKNNQLVLLGDCANGLSGWEETRRMVYEFVYGESNLSAGSLLFRALDFAMREGELTRDYFMMTDEQAFDYLLNQCNPRTRDLVDRANKWVFYKQAYSLRRDRGSEGFVNFVMDTDNRGRFADEIGELLKIPPEDVCVYMGRDKGFKRIHLPIVGDGTMQTHQPLSEQAYFIKVFVHPKWQTRESDVCEIAEDRIRRF